MSASTEAAMVGVSTRVPKTLWKKVKELCAKNDKTVQEHVIALLEKSVKK